MDILSPVNTPIVTVELAAASISGGREKIALGKWPFFPSCLLRLPQPTNRTFLIEGGSEYV